MRCDGGAGDQRFNGARLGEPGEQGDKGQWSTHISFGFNGARLGEPGEQRRAFLRRWKSSCFNGARLGEPGEPP